MLHGRPPRGRKRHHFKWSSYYTTLRGVNSSGSLALLLARDGLLAEAEETGRRAVELAETTDFVETRALARRFLSETLALGGNEEQALEQAEIALALLRAKGDVTLAGRVREHLARVGVDIA
jgi:hypothetical protein